MSGQRLKPVLVILFLLFCGQRWITLRDLVDALRQTPGDFSWYGQTQLDGPAGRYVYLLFRPPRSVADVAYFFSDDKGAEYMHISDIFIPD